MINVMKSVIANGGYKLTEIQRKVKKLYLIGDISESQMDELLHLAAEGVCAEAERPEMTEIVRTLAEQIESLAARISALEGGEAETEKSYPAWMPWNGISKNYPQGAIVSHNEKLWISVFNGQNVWEPNTVGADFWVPYTE